AATGKKYYNVDSDLHNIAAIQLTPDSRENIVDVFSALSVNWAYLPDFHGMKKYRDFYAKNYENDCMMLFDKILLSQTKLLRTIKGDTVEELIKNIINLSDGKTLALYGAGKIGKKFESYLTHSSKDYLFIVSDDQEIKDHNEYHVSEVSVADKTIVVTSIFEEILENLIEKEISFYTLPAWFVKKALYGDCL
nr:hypothetical protein [Lachnospiraceae bacterium]